jgi:hypothetical protein
MPGGTAPPRSPRPFQRSKVIAKNCLRCPI